MNVTVQESQTGLYVNALLSYVESWLADALEHLVISLFLYLIVCLCLYRWIFRPVSLKLRSAHFPERHKRVLLVLAHPDDECMFFGPTILSLCRRADCQVYLLCLSIGDHEQKGRIRREELFRSCHILNMRPENITIMNLTELPDDPGVEWKVGTIARQIEQMVDALEIEALITFDRDGVSQHPNHTAIFYAASSLCLAGMMPNDCKFYTLESTNLLRKYMLVLDLPITLLLSRNWFVLRWCDRRIVMRAMQEHRSQFVWFRKLYILFSRYMLMNSLRELSVADIELEMQLDDS
ncbi:N-acetylglucosaminyl-phosphatidylinositol de-N-acetylase [Phlebotomus argentipes]|uniref:N-acetylglucosaminyl-phosphatidylinositol de-N-acetylase n=1 Tax=Phlebotomus argentipes TaxID=94469 RepID=UPI002892C58C|nr:N-acetylglucosaminyl-phosphatidylinositol de-N-acetylase [Phlebotomus argentipes]